MKNTGTMCMIAVHNPNNEDGMELVDLGNYFIDDNGKKCVMLTETQAKKYSHLVDVPVIIYEKQMEDM